MPTEPPTRVAIPIHSRSLGLTVRLDGRVISQNTALTPARYARLVEQAAPAEQSSPHYRNRNLTAHYRDRKIVAVEVAGNPVSKDPARTLANLIATGQLGNIVHLEPPKARKAKQ